MTTAKATTCGTIDTEVTITNLQYIGGCTATRTVCTTMPAPTVVGNQTATTCAESVILAIALGKSRWIVDIRFSYLRLCGNSKTESRQNCM